MYVRGGAIISMGPAMNWVDEKSADPLNFEIYPDAQGKAEGSLYEDDGVSPAYRNGAERRTTLSYQSSRVTLSAPAGSYQPGPRTMVFSVHAGSREAKPAQLADDGKAHTISVR